MKKEGVVLMFMVLLFASVFVPSTTAVPSSRSLRSITETFSNRHISDDFQVKGRMGVEVTDYSGTGANNHHDPSPPGKS